MSNLLIPRREIWTQQPQGPVEIDRRLIPDGSIVWTPNSLTKNVGALVHGANRAGRFVRSVSGSSNINLGIVKQAQAGSFSILAQVELTGTGQACVAGTISTGFNYLEQLFVNTNLAGAAAPGRLSMGFRSQAGSSLTLAVATTGAALTVGKVHVVGINFTSSSTIDLYVDGVKVETEKTPYTGGTTSGNTDFYLALLGRQLRGTIDQNGGINCGLYVRAPKLLDLERLTANPWQIFAPQTRNLFVPVSVGGTTTVTSDSTAAYKVQGSIQSSSVAAYGIRSAIQSDSVASYAIRASAQNDAASAYSIRGSIQQSSAAAYLIRGLVDQTIAAIYGIRSAVSSDAAATYNILSATSVSASASAGYNIRSSVDRTTSASYALRGSVTQDTSTSYSIISASSVTSSVTAGYAVKGSVQSSIVAGYSVAQSVQMEVLAGYQLRGEVTKEVQAVYSTRGTTQQSVTSSYLVSAVQSVSSPAQLKLRSPYFLMTLDGLLDTYRSIDAYQHLD